MNKQEHNNEDKILLPHHEQQSLCTTRLPYRQGRKLTAVKVYSIINESNHLLIFGVPSLNLRQETKALFIKFGKLLQFNISKEHASEVFTETYHAQYDRIHSARLAKRMLDTRNFYGATLHVCYAPELENINETRQKLIQRQQDVTYRLKNLHNEPHKETVTFACDNTTVSDPIKLNMGDVNTICIGENGNRVIHKKRKLKDKQKFEPCFVDNKKIVVTQDNELTSEIITESNEIICNMEVRYNNDRNKDNNITKCKLTQDITVCNITSNNTVGNPSQDIDVVDCTGVDEEVITNINECLNYNKFGNEIIRKIPQKAPNKIQFHINKKS